MKYTFSLILVSLLTINPSFSQEVRWSFNLSQNPGELSSAKTISKTLDGNYIMTALDFIDRPSRTWSNQAIFYNSISGDTTMYNIGLEQKTPLFVEALSLDDYLMVMTNGEIYKLNFENETYILQQRLEFDSDTLEILFVDKIENTLMITGENGNKTVHFEYALDELNVTNTYAISNPIIPEALAYLPNGDQVRCYNPDEDHPFITRKTSNDKIIWESSLISEDFFITDVAVHQDIIYLSSTKSVTEEGYGSPGISYAVIFAYNQDGEKLWETEILAATADFSENRAIINKIEIT